MTLGRLGFLGTGVGRLGGSGGGSSGPPPVVGPEAPVLVWLSGETDNTPQMQATYPDVLPPDTDLETQFATDATFTSDLFTVEHTLSAGEAAILTMDQEMPDVLSDATWYVRHRYYSTADSAWSEWSNTVTKAIDAAPVLTSPTAVKTGQTTADLGVTTDQTGGLLYWVVTTSATAPSASQIKAGQDHLGASSPNGSQAASTTGAQAISATGLVIGATQYAHFMHEDAGAHQSNVVGSASFTTDSGASYTHCSTQNAAPGTDTVASFTVDIGAAAADRLIVIGYCSQQTTNLTSIVCNGVTLTQDALTSGCGFFSGIVAAGSGNVTVSVNHSSGAAFKNRGISVFRLTGLNSNLKKQATSGAISSLSIPVDGGDFVFAAKYLAPGATWAGSDAAPAATHSAGAGGQVSTADWLISSADASFATVPGTGGSNPQALASYR